MWHSVPLRWRRQRLVTVLGFPLKLQRGTCASEVETGYKMSAEEQLLDLSKWKPAMTDPGNFREGTGMGNRAGKARE